MINKVARLAFLGMMVVAVSAIAAEPKKKLEGATTRPSQKQVVKTVRGEIARVDIENNTLDVEVTRKQETEHVQVVTNADTEVLLDGELASIVDLRAGMRVSFQPDSGVATRVSAKSMTSREQKEFKEKKKAKAD